MDVPSIEDPAIIDRLRSALDVGGFTESGIAQAMGSSGRDGGAVARRVRARRLPVDEPLGLFIRLFLMGEAVSEDKVSAHLDMQALAGIGILAHTPGGIRSNVRIDFLENLLIVGEPDDPNETRADRVPSVHSASKALADLTVRRSSDLALDMGTGCGVQALLASSHSEKVIGADVNPRAIGFARFNAALNQVSNTVFVKTSFFEPISHGAFDLVVANPPFVISPDRDFLFRDAGTRGEALSREVVQAAAATLREGGFASVLCNWTAEDERKWWEGAAGWLDGTGCDSWMLQGTLEDPVGYAANFNASLAAGDGDEFERVVARWAEWYAEAGIRHIAIGAFVIRKRRATSNWQRVASLLDAAAGPGSDHLLRMFDGVDSVLDLSPEFMLRSAFAPVEGHRIEETISFGSGGYKPGRTIACASNGIGIQVVLEPHVLPVLFACDGRGSLIECVRLAEAQVGTRRSDLEQPAVDAIRALTEAGYFRLSG